MSQRFGFVIGVFFLTAYAGWGQSTTDGAIGGAVTDPSGAVVPGVAVSAKSVATNATTTGTTDAAGRFNLIHLPPGLYDLTINAKGFATYSVTGVTVEVGRVTPQDLSLSVQGTTTAVSVTGEAPVVNLEQQD